MKLTTFFTGTATAAMVAQLAGASPTLADAVTPKAKEFFLKTAVKKGSNAKFNGLYRKPGTFMTCFACSYML